MYSIKVESPDEHYPVIKRSLVADAAIQLIPIIVEISRAEFNFINPVAVYMGNGMYHIFDLCNPDRQAIVTNIKDGN